MLTHEHPRQKALHCFESASHLFLVSTDFHWGKLIQIILCKCTGETEIKTITLMCLFSFNYKIQYALFILSFSFTYIRVNYEGQINRERPTY